MTGLVLAAVIVAADAPTQGRPLFASEGKTSSLRTIALNSVVVYHVKPYAFYSAPYSTNPRTLDVQLIKPPRAGQLPNSFKLQSGNLVGAATIVLPLIKIPPEGSDEKPAKHLVVLKL